MGYDFKYAGTALSELYGVTTERPPREVALYDFSLTDIPGRSGSEYKDNRRYKNVSFTRKIGFIQRGGRTADEICEQLINWLAYHQGYQEFEDSDHSGMVTYAALTNLGEIQQTFRRLRTATLKFSRVPFWYDKRSLNGVVLTAENTAVNLFNPYPIEALPLIKITLKDEVSAGLRFVISNNGQRFTYLTNSFPLRDSGTLRKYIVFDCEDDLTKIQVTEDGENMKYVDVSTPGVLLPGGNSIELVSGTSNVIESMTVIPRWRCL